MYVAVQHQISDPEAFWGHASEMVPNLPGYVTLHQCFPTKDGARGICIWEGQSVDSVRTFLDGEMAKWSKNDYFEVENKEAIALPPFVSAAASR